MSSVIPQIIEEKTDLKNRRKKNLEVKIVSYDTAKKLGDALCNKYKKAFDLLKDK